MTLFILSILTSHVFTCLVSVSVGGRSDETDCGAVQGDVVIAVVPAVLAPGIGRAMPVGRRAIALERSDVKLRCFSSTLASVVVPLTVASMLDIPIVFRMAG